MTTAINPEDLAPYVLDFPLRSRKVRKRTSSQVPHILIESLGVETLVTYLRLLMWHDLGEYADLGRVATELWWGDRERAATWLGSVRDAGLLRIGGGA